MVAGSYNSWDHRQEVRGKQGQGMYPEATLSGFVVDYFYSVQEWPGLEARDYRQKSPWQARQLLNTPRLSLIEDSL